MILHTSSPYNLIFLLASIAITQAPTSLADVNALYTPMGSYSVGEEIPLTWKHDGKGVATVNFVAVNRDTGVQSFLGTGQSKDQILNVHWDTDIGPGDFHLILFQKTPEKILYSGNFTIYEDSDEDDDDSNWEDFERVGGWVPKLFSRSFSDNPVVPIGPVLNSQQVALPSPPSSQSPLVLHDTGMAPIQFTASPALVSYPLEKEDIHQPQEANEAIEPAVAPSAEQMGIPTPGGVAPLPGTLMTLAMAEPSVLAPTPTAPAAPTLLAKPLDMPSQAMPILEGPLANQLMKKAEESVISVLHTYLNEAQTLPTAIAFAATTISIPSPANHFAFSYPATETRWSSPTPRSIPVNGMFNGKVSRKRASYGAVSATSGLAIPHVHIMVGPAVPPSWTWTLLLALPAAQAAVGNINTPVGPFIPGSIMTVNWIQDASTGSNPKETQLELVNKKTGTVRPIDRHVKPDAGSYNWTIPKNLTPGEYYIRMTGGRQPIFTGEFQVNPGDGSSSGSSNDAGPQPGQNDAADATGDDNNTHSTRTSSATPLVLPLYPLLLLPSASLLWSSIPF
ncbi:hypothetical protein BJ684DRAFT_18400 [Piptocephalis cylindrospora]|uniref:Yeast cell wall synthesis Kre9/Knh1-like N-terminal domain-containing protein n=1 Tax=Piptocephalis cylindrospora TaxID=1907219 RepID=A0A4P9Y8A0_9FUNG|nr:hypothetical protein BJ684DRAFT_18400 [Piptocephalis cylindrospora]|eukprot:RKP15255.1 hypothetical protein BJ684DRAFT_18400 [Piptocephalis cylindrospora]